MSRSLWTIAELAWRQLNPKGNEEAKNTVEEFVETAKDEYANLAFRMYLELRNESDLSLVENLLTRKKYNVLYDEEIPYVLLETDVLDLPKDLGVFHVQPAKQKPLIKGALVSQNLYKDDPGERSYYRLGKKIYFPDGFAVHNTKEVMIATVSMDDVDDSLEVPDIFAAPIRSALWKTYAPGVQIPQDPSNNKNADN